MHVNKRKKMKERGGEREPFIDRFHNFVYFGSNIVMSQ